MKSQHPFAPAAVSARPAVSARSVVFARPAVSARLVLSILAVSSASFLFAGCGSSLSARLHGSETKPLSQLSYKFDTISTGTGIRILGFSGGKISLKDNVFYSQFIGIEKGTGDTVRILAGWIQGPRPQYAPETSRLLLTSAYMFDSTKHILDAVYQAPDEHIRLLMNLDMGLHDDNIRDTAEIIKNLHDTTPLKNQAVIIQKDMPLFNGNYKTAIGILKFEEKPW